MCIFAVFAYLKMAIILIFYCVFNMELRELFERERYRMDIDVDVGEILASGVARIFYKRCLSEICI